MTPALAMQSGVRLKEKGKKGGNGIKGEKEKRGKGRMRKEVKLWYLNTMLNLHSAIPRNVTIASRGSVWDGGTEN